MEITAKLISLGNATEGPSTKGPWRKATAVFETQEQFTKTIAVDFFNTKLEEVTKIPLGSVCIVKFDVSSREFNGKWYTNCNGFGVEVQGQSAPQGSIPSSSIPSQQPQQPSWDTPVPPLGQTEGVEEPDDLPF